MTSDKTNSIGTVMSRMLEPAGLGEQQLGRTLASIMQGGVDYADLYFQISRSESWSVEDRIIREGSFNLDQGVGVRAVSGEKTGLAYSDELLLPALERAAAAARAIARQGGPGTLKAWQRNEPPSLYPVADPTTSISDSEKTAFLGELEQATRDLDDRIEQVMISLASTQDLVLVAASDGTLAADIRPLVRLNVSVILEQDGRRESGYSGGGARSDLRYFLVGDTAIDYAREAVRQASVQLEASDAPAGMMPVVLGPGWPGILLHEAVGHGLEGDFNRKGTSAFSGRVGERVAPADCTIVDDGTLPNRRGSLAIDDEGTPGRYNVLVENGVLKGYMQDKLNARLMGVAPTGNGRRESFAHMPMPRMTNTYMLAGPTGGHHVGQIRVLGERGLPDRERQDYDTGKRCDVDR